jgi:hypothetical protein
MARDDAAEKAIAVLAYPLPEHSLTNEPVSVGSSVNRAM